jgi:2-polyprenyl-6-methoxyphenol hydroxylase-like FAD-dependent oxidoreductase
LTATGREILIVGAGPTGLTLACELLRQGAACRIVEQAPRPTERSRAIGVSPRSLEILDELGAAEELVELGLPSPVANIYSDRRLVARFGSARIRHTRFPFLLAVPQSDTEAVLCRALERFGGRVERGVTVRAVRDRIDELVVTLEERGSASEHTARWVVGADGAHSTVRRSIGVPFTGRATGHIFINVDVTLDGGPAPGEGHYFFSPAGLLVIAPLPGGVYRTTALVSSAEDGVSFDVQDIQRLIDERCPPGIRVRSVHDAGWGVARFTVQARIADRFVLGRKIIAGDAAHIFGPVGAQGMNAGIQDAHNLAWKLALVQRGRASERLLDTYDCERRTVAHEILHAVEAQARFATIRSRLGGGARDVLLRAASSTGVLDRAIVPRISQLGIRYRDSAMDGEQGARRGPLGLRIPDLPLRSPGGVRTRLHELLGRGPFTAIVLDPGPQLGLQELETQMEERHVELLAIRSPGALDRPAGSYVDLDGALLDFLRGDVPALCLVRPDAHVASVGRVRERGSILESVDRALGRLTGAPAAAAAMSRHSDNLWMPDGQELIH